MARLQIPCVALILTIHLVMLLLVLFVDPANPSSVFYKDFGKFSHWDFFHWKHRPIVLLPEDPKKLAVEFLLFTRRNPYDPERYTYKDGIDPSIRGTNFDPLQETKIIIHGKMVNPHQDPWIFRMKDAWLQSNNYNVIIMDWSRGNTVFTPKAVANARVCGPMLGMFILDLCRVFHLDPGWFHLLGHGQGAHIAGIAGKWLGNQRLGQITALDPSGAFYQGLKDKRSGLWHTDARFVEAIHTSGSEKSSYLKSGMHETCSHVDIFPNGGEHQPGCGVKRRVSYLLHKSYLESFDCSHYRSVEYYLETIDSIPGFSTPVAYACESYQLFLDGQCHSCGEDGTDCAIVGPLNRLYALKNNQPLDSFQGKRFYMLTDDQRHYFKYQYLVIIQMAPNDQHQYEVRKGKLSLRFWSIESVRSRLKAEADNDHDEKEMKKKKKKMEKHGKTMIDFYEKPEKFRYGHSYRQVLLSDVDPEYLGAIELRWKTDKKKKDKDTIFIEHVDVVPLSFKSPLLPPKDSSIFLRFTVDGNRIPNRRTVMLKRVDIRRDSNSGVQQSSGNHSNSEKEGKFEAQKLSSKMFAAQRAAYNNPEASYQILWI